MVIGYILVWFISGTIAMIVDPRDGMLLAMGLVLWPFTLPLLLILFLMGYIADAVVKRKAR